MTPILWVFVAPQSRDGDIILLPWRSPRLSHDLHRRVHTKQQQNETRLPPCQTWESLGGRPGSLHRHLDLFIRMISPSESKSGES